MTLRRAATVGTGDADEVEEWRSTPSARTRRKILISTAAALRRAATTYDADEVEELGGERGRVGGQERRVGPRRRDGVAATRRSSSRREGQ